MFATTLDGVELWWERLGEGPTVILVPGRGDSSDLSPQLFAEHLLDAGISVIRMDPRDTGLSGDGGDTYTLSTLADDIIVVLDAAGVEHAHTVAVSMGGMITVDLVSRFPQRVLTSSFIAAMSPDPAAGMGPDFFAALGDTDRTTMLLAMMGTPDDSDRQWLQDELNRAGQRAPDRPEAGERHMAASFRFGWPELQQLGNFRTPALVVHGTADRLLPVAHAQALASGIVGSELVLLDGMGHLPTRSEWKQITGRIAQQVLS